MTLWDFKELIRKGILIIEEEQNYMGEEGYSNEADVYEEDLQLLKNKQEELVQYNVNLTLNVWNSTELKLSDVKPAFETINCILQNRAERIAHIADDYQRVLKTEEFKNKQTPTENEVNEMRAEEFMNGQISSEPFDMNYTKLVDIITGYEKMLSEAINVYQDFLKKLLKINPSIFPDASITGYKLNNIRTQMLKDIHPFADI